MQNRCRCNWRATSTRSLPDAQSAVIGHAPKIVIARQQYEVVANAELRKEGVDSSYLHASTAADIAKFCRVDVILPVRHQQRQSCESLNDLLASFGT